MLKLKTNLKILLAIVLSLIVGVIPTASTYAVTATQSIAIPVYQYPTLQPWPTFNAAGSQIPFVVVNPAGGPGAVVDPNYTTQIATNTTAGQRSIGYVTTTFQTRPIQAVLDDIDDWYTMYPGISGILVDSVQNTSASDLCYLAYTYNYIKKKQPTHLVADNFGTHVGPAVEPYGDIFLNAEMDFALYQTWGGPTANGFEDVAANSNRFWHVIHTTTAGANYTTALTQTRNNNAGWVYITDDTLANPYDATPSYFATELTDVATLPASTLPNRGLTQLPAGCADVNVSSTTNSTTGTQQMQFNSQITVENDSASVAGQPSMEVNFTLPTGVTLTSASGTGWTCGGNTCTYNTNVAPGADAAVLGAQFNVGCSYTGGNVGVSAENFAGNPDTDTVTLSGPGDCAVAAASTPALAATGINQPLIIAAALGLVLFGMGVLIRQKWFSI